MLPVNAENPQALGVPFSAILFFLNKTFLISDTKQYSILRFFHYVIYLSAPETHPVSVSLGRRCLFF